MTSLPVGTIVKVSPRMVDFQLSTGWGLQCQRVLIIGSEPRFMSWTEKLSSKGLEVSPLAASLTEIQVYVAHAVERLGDVHPDVLPHNTSDDEV